MARRYDREGRIIVYQVIPIDDPSTAYNSFFTFDPDEAKEYENDRRYEVEELLEDRIQCQDIQNVSPSRFSDVLDRIRQYFRAVFCKKVNNENSLSKARCK